MKSDNILDYRDSHKEEGKGAVYDESFYQSNYKGYIYRWEKEVLESLWSETRPSKYMDFACGTGRITNLATGHASHVMGVDVSPSMLEVARKKYPAITFIERDLTQSTEGIDRNQDAISTFRFFTNAQESLRKEALSSLTDLLKPDGLLVFNLHMNSKSPFALMARAYELFFGKRKGFNHIDLSYMKNQLHLSAHYDVINIYAKGVIPVIREEKIYPAWMFKGIEVVERMLSIIPGYKSICKYQIIVCKKKG